MSSTANGAGRFDDSLARLYQERSHQFLRVAEALVGDPDRGHDVVQEAFVRALGRQASFRGDGSLEGWVWTILVNTGRNAKRDSAHRSAVDAGAAEGVEDDADPGDRQVRELIATLPERQRLVLFLRHYADLDYTQIGAALGIQPGTVGATLNQAHRNLARLLQEVSS